MNGRNQTAPLAGGNCGAAQKTEHLIVGDTDVYLYFTTNEKKAQASGMAASTFAFLGGGHV